MRQFYFIRHGQTDWNAEGRMQGRADIPLNAAGIAQAVAAAAHYANNPVDRIISSPQLRAQVTAQHIADRLQVPLVFDDRLIERCIGSLEGMTPAEIEAGDPALLYDHTITNDWVPGRPTPKGSETLGDVASRAYAAVMHYLALYPDEELLFVAHGAWFRALVHHLRGGYIHCENAVPYIFMPQENTWLVNLATEV